MNITDITQEKINKIREIFPDCVKESQVDGKEQLYIDYDALREILKIDLFNDVDGCYQLTWPNKKEAKFLASKDSLKSLCACAEESVDFEKTQNLYIEGDNLDALKILRKTYSNKIDIIYIDPPYNTGRNLIYRNDFYCNKVNYKGANMQEENFNLEYNGRLHTDWLNMMYTRLMIAKDLLAEDGIIVVTIDDCEIQNLILIMNEIYGERNHLGTIVVKNNPSGRSTASGLSISHEYALFYAKSPDVKIGRLPRNRKQLARYNHTDDKGPFEWVNFRARYSAVSQRLVYPIFVKEDGSDFRIPELVWNIIDKKYDLLEKPLSDEIVLLPIDNSGTMRNWKWSVNTARELKNTDMAIRKDCNGQSAVFVKVRVNKNGMLPLTVWDDTKYSSTEYGTNYLTELMGKKYFDYPKSIYAVIDCLKVAKAKEKTNAIILDFFSGSATTADAVMQLNIEDDGNRKFIMVQLPEQCDEDSEAFKAGYNNICKIGETRIRKVGTKLKEQYSDRAKNLDTGFKVFKLQ